MHGRGDHLYGRPGGGGMRCPICNANKWHETARGIRYCGTCLYHEGAVVEIPTQNDSTLPPDALIVCGIRSATAYCRGRIIGPLPKDDVLRELRRIQRGSKKV